MMAGPTFTEWHDLQVNTLNRMPMHTNFFPFKNYEEAKMGDPKRSENYLSCMAIGNLIGWKMPTNVLPAFTKRTSTMPLGAPCQCLVSGS